MPYSERQLHCMDAMGITPWVLRDSAEQVEQVASPAVVSNNDHASVKAPTPISTPDIASNDKLSLLDYPLVAMPFRGAQHVQLGKALSPLLILVEACASEQSQYPFEAADAKMFDDMMRAISWRRQNVCLALMAYKEASSQSPIQHGKEATAASVKDVLTKPRDAVLVFSQRVTAGSTLDDLRIELPGVSASIWRIPHPALLRREPVLKRLAWTALKAARAAIREV